jgi:hypothetical protein
MKADMKKCPLLNKPCIKDDCMWWTHLRGKNPQSMAETDDSTCSVPWLVVLLVENAQFIRQTAAAVDDLKNETVQRQDLFNHTLNTALNDRRKQLKELGNE